MREAVIVSAARTPIGKAFRGAFNQTPGATLAGHVVRNAIERAGVDPAEVEDVVIGSGLPEGATGNNIGRTAALRAGCPVTVPGQTVSRYCASGLDAIASAAKRVMVDGADVVVAGGVESISHGAEQSEHGVLTPKSGCCAIRPTCTCRCSTRPTTLLRSTTCRANGRTSTRCRASSVPLLRKTPAVSMPRSWRCRPGSTIRTKKPARLRKST